MKLLRNRNGLFRRICSISATSMIFYRRMCKTKKKKQNLKCLVTPTVSFTVYDCFLHRLRKFIIYLSLSPNLLSKETIFVVVVDVDWCLSSKNFALLIVSLPKIKPSKYSAYYILLPFLKQIETHLNFYFLQPVEQI